MLDNLLYLFRVFFSNLLVCIYLPSRRRLFFQVLLVAPSPIRLCRLWLRVGGSSAMAASCEGPSRPPNIMANSCYVPLQAVHLLPPYSPPQKWAGLHLLLCTGFCLCLGFLRFWPVCVCFAFSREIWPEVFLVHTIRPLRSLNEPGLLVILIIMSSWGDWVIFVFPYFSPSWLA